MQISLHTYSEEELKSILSGIFGDSNNERYKFKLEQITDLGDAIKGLYCCDGSPRFGSISIQISKTQKQVKFCFIKQNAGFYNLLGRQVLVMKSIINYPKLLDFSIEIDGSQTWGLFKPHENFDLYSLLFKRDDTLSLNIPYIGPTMSKNNMLYKKLNLIALNSLLKKYYSMSDTQEKYFDELKSFHDFDPDNTIGVMYRGTDKMVEMTVADPQEYINLINEISKTNPKSKIFIQTDQSQVRDLFEKTFGNRCFYFPQVPVTHSNISVHHLIANFENKLEYIQSLEIACRFLSICRHLIISSGNVGWAIAGYRGNANNLWQFDFKGSLISPN